jgi:multiple sugar transport system ATP-binding protein
MTLSLNAITKTFGSQTILHNLDLSVGNGECVALLGPSGCGKSTALRLIAGLDQPDSGSISIDGAEMVDVPAEDRRIGMVFQSYALFPHLSVRENLELGLRMRGSHGAVRDQRIKTILEVLQLSQQAHQRPAQLSGGQRQRVALARALLRDPLVYLLDEPMSNLDAQLREELRPELKRLMLGGSQPVVYVTHDQQEAMALADRIAVMRHGRIEQIGTPRELYHHPATSFVAQFIGRPQMNMLSAGQRTEPWASVQRIFALIPMASHAKSRAVNGMERVNSSCFVANAGNSVWFVLATNTLGRIRT